MPNLFLISEKNRNHNNDVCTCLSEGCINYNNKSAFNQVASQILISENDEFVSYKDANIINNIPYITIFNDNLVSADLYKTVINAVYVKCVYNFNGYFITINFIPIVGAWAIDIPNNDEYNNLIDNNMKLKVSILHVVEFIDDIQLIGEQDKTAIYANNFEIKAYVEDTKSNNNLS